MSRTCEKCRELLNRPAETRYCGACLDALRRALPPLPGGPAGLPCVPPATPHVAAAWRAEGAAYTAHLAGLFADAAALLAEAADAAERAVEAGEPDAPDLAVRLRERLRAAPMVDQEPPR